jgi:hypothetical protein|tara:strand:- start:751 stop:1080 length:330 start_codon:yes stop_codon:yes gene_type:complete
MLDLNEKSVEDALQWMTENDEKLAEKKSNYHHLDRFSKTLKAQLMAKESSNMSVSAREQLALANEAFLTHLDGLNEAEREYLALEYKMEQKKLICQLWQTFSANRRQSV